MRLPVGGAAQPDPLFRSNDERSLYTVGVQQTHIFSPTVLNVANFGFSHARGQNQVKPIEEFPDNLLLMKGDTQKNPGAFTFGGAAVTVVATTLVTPNGSNPHYNERRNFSAYRFTLGEPFVPMNVAVPQLLIVVIGSGLRGLNSKRTSRSSVQVNGMLRDGKLFSKV